MTTLKRGTLQEVAYTTNLLEERVVRPKDRTHHMPLFQARTRQGLQGDHRGHWLLQETQKAPSPTQRPPFKCATQRGNAVLQPIIEKSPDHSDKIELSTE